MDGPWTLGKPSILGLAAAPFRIGSMRNALQPAFIPAPLAPHSHCIEEPAGRKLVFCSGQLGAHPDGSVPRDCSEPAELCFAHVAAILAEAGFSLEHVIRINAFVSGREHLAPYMEVRNRLFSAPYPASTLVIV